MSIHTTSHTNTQLTDSAPFDSHRLSNITAEPVIPAQHKNRLTLLRCIVRTVCRRVHLDRFGLRPIQIDPRLMPAFTAVVVEMADISGELGVTDDIKVKMIAETIGISTADVWPVWTEWKAKAESNAAKCSDAAHRALDRLGASSKGHTKLADARTISEALAWWPSRREEVYPRRKGERRANSGLPLWLGEGREERQRTAESKRWTYSREELRMWVGRYGYKAGTVKRYAWTMSREEFDRLVAKKEAKILPAERLSGRKRPGESDYTASIRISAEAPKTRKRAFCVTAARREYCKAFGCKRTTALRRTDGLNAGQVMSLVEQKLSPHGQDETDKTVPNETDNSRENHRLDHNSRGKNVPCASSGDRTVGADEIEIVHQWYQATKGRPLRRENLKKMRQRGKLERNVSDACAWFEADGDDDDLKPIAEAWNDGSRERGNERRQAERHRKAIRSGPLAELTVPA
ncbi:hypothetical protein ABS772_23700 [Methylorubrum podarium]|uniref:Uncharacterized protein n=1 Tax=Methylorubrum podarium TaxID=200476 RepID=A0ABV1QUB2_9HYPH